MAIDARDCVSMRMQGTPEQCVVCVWAHDMSEHVSGLQSLILELSFCLCAFDTRPLLVRPRSLQMYCTHVRAAFQSMS